MTWQPIPELFELVTWADINEGDHVWSMGGVCVITRARFRNDDDYDAGLVPGAERFGHRNESGAEFAPPMELTSRVPRLLPPGHPAALEQMDARAAFAGALAGLHADMLTRGADITDDTVWKPAKREFLLVLIKLAQTELHGATWLARNATGEGP
jgi:hypothetical protein